MMPTTNAINLAALLLLLLSTVEAFISTPLQCGHSTRSSLREAYIDEGYPHAPREESLPNINGNNNDSGKKSKPAIKKPPKTLPNGGTITLVGAGPGDPSLLTVAAHKILTDPTNYIIVDRLVSKEILDLIEGEYRVANKHPGCQEVAQKEIYEWCMDGLREGRKVVRLKIGEL